MIDFILDEFDEKYDINNPCLLYFGFKRREYEFFEYLVNKYKDEYNLKNICDSLESMITDVIPNHDSRWDHNWCKYDHIECRKLLNKIHKY